MKFYKYSFKNKLFYRYASDVKISINGYNELKLDDIYNGLIKGNRLYISSNKFPEKPINILGDENNRKYLKIFLTDLKGNKKVFYNNLISLLQAQYNSISSSESLEDIRQQLIKEISKNDTDLYKLSSVYVKLFGAEDFKADFSEIVRNLTRDDIEKNKSNLMHMINDLKKVKTLVGLKTKIEEIAEESKGTDEKSEFSFIARIKRTSSGKKLDIDNATLKKLFLENLSIATVNIMRKEECTFFDVYSQLTSLTSLKKQPDFLKQYENLVNKLMAEKNSREQSNIHEINSNMSIRDKAIYVAWKYCKIWNVNNWGLWIMKSLMDYISKINFDKFDSTFLKPEKKKENRKKIKEYLIEEWKEKYRIELIKKIEEKAIEQINKDFLYDKDFSENYQKFKENDPDVNVNKLDEAFDECIDTAIKDLGEKSIIDYYFGKDEKKALKFRSNDTLKLIKEAVLEDLKERIPMK